MLLRAGAACLQLVVVARAGDWDDARRKMVAISPAGRQARDAAVNAITPMISNVVDDLGEEQVRATLPILRALRRQLSQG